MQQNPSKGVLVTDVGVNLGILDLKNHMGLILGNGIGLILGITPHPPVLIRRSESTLPLVVMAVNNPLLL